MTEFPFAEILRRVIRDFEDRRIGVGELGREVLFVAQQIHDGERSPNRMALVRLGNRLRAVAEGGLANDARDEVRGYVDELHDQILEF